MCRYHTIIWYLVCPSSLTDEYKLRLLVQSWCWRFVSRLGRAYKYDTILIFTCQVTSRDKILPHSVNRPQGGPIMRWLLEHFSDSTFDSLRRLSNTQIGLLICMICRVGHEGMRRAMRVRGGRYVAYFTGLELEAPRSIILGLRLRPIRACMSPIRANFLNL